MNPCNLCGDGDTRLLMYPNIQPRVAPGAPLPPTPSICWSCVKAVVRFYQDFTDVSK